MLDSAYQIIQAGNYRCPDNFKEILRQYQEEDFRLDYEYRRFYSAYDQLEETAAFEPLRDLIENIYTRLMPEGTNPIPRTKFSLPVRKRLRKSST